MGACGSKNVEADTPREVAQVGTQAKPAPVHEEAADTNQITIKITEPEKKCDPQIAAYLSHVPLLNKLMASEKETLGANLIEKKYVSNEIIIREGDDGDEFFLIKEGICVVSKIDPATQERNELCHLKEGDYFGEGALRTNSKRAATITASGPVTLLTLNRQKFSELFGGDKLQVKFAKRVAVSAEAYDAEKEHQASVPKDAMKKKTAEQKQFILEVVKRNILFKNLDLAQCSEIVDEMWLKQVNPGVSIIRQGESGDNFYVVAEGEFNIFVKKGKDGVEKKVATCGDGTSFGELALMYNAPRAATVTASMKSAVWAVDRWTFRRVLTKVSRAKITEYENFLAQVESFSSLLASERAQVAEALEEFSYPDGHDIVTEGDAGDTFFILRKGEVVVRKMIDGVNKEVKRYKPGEYFGERALIKNEARAATCTTVGPAECLCLNRKAFVHLLGPLEELFSERVGSYGHGKPGEVSARKPRAEPKPAKLDDFLRKDLDIKDMTIIGTLGKGSFGHVQLVKDKTGKTYALKSVNKAQIVRLGQQKHIISEKRVMAALDHPFLVKLWATFKDKNHLYFLLEPSLGGELFSVLRAKTFFDEPTARFYAAGVVLAFDYMHNKNIIYRDLKPENLLLDNHGYLKITDFGFAKVVKDRTWTLCGTPDYMAPEVVTGQGHNKGVDWWTLGILIYEMLASYPPFYDEDTMKTYSKMMQGQLAFPMHFSKTVVDLIRRLLHHKPTKRLGVLRGGAKLIVEHAWFRGFDWDSFLKRRLPAPIVQKVSSAEDISNFEEYPDDDEPEEVYVEDRRNPDWDADF